MAYWAKKQKGLGHPHEGVPGPQNFAFLVLAIGLVLTCLSWQISRVHIEMQARLKFENERKDIESRIRRQLDLYIDTLYGAQALFAASKTVERSAWSAYMQRRQFSRKYPGVIAMEYVQRVPHKDKDRFLKSVQHDTTLSPEGFPDFEIFPRGDRDEYFVVNYLEPFKENLGVFGYDLGAGSAGRSTLEKARDTGKPVSTGKVLLAQADSPGLQAGIRIFLPIYKNGLPLSTVAERRSALRGFSAAVIRTGDLFSHIFEERMIRPGIDFEIFDGPDPSPEKLLFDFDHMLHAGKGETQFAVSVPFEVAGQTWTVYYSAASKYGTEYGRGTSLLILGSGILASFLLFGLFYSLGNSRARALRLAEKMTRALRHEIQEREEAQKRLSGAFGKLEKTSRDLVAANEKLRELDLLKSNFISAASHELRTPLTSIKGYAALMLRAKDDEMAPRLKEYLSYVKLATDRLHRLVNDLLDLSKIEAGKTGGEFAWTDPKDWIQQERMVYQGQADHKEIPLSVEFREPIPQVYCDPNAMRQVVGNLLSNALKYTPAHGRVRVTAFFENDFLVVDVEDTGIGIKSSDQERIFEPFCSIVKGLSDNQDSTGLGLSLVKKIVELHGGSIRVESEEKKGSKFTLRIPKEFKVREEEPGGNEGSVQP